MSDQEEKKEVTPDYTHEWVDVPVDAKTEIILLSDPVEVLKSFPNAVSQINTQSRTEGKKYIENIKKANSYESPDLHEFSPFNERLGQWDVKVRKEDVDVKNSFIRFNKLDSSKLSESELLLKASSLAGTGVPVLVRFWNSGFSAIVKPIGDLAMFDFFISLHIKATEELGYGSMLYKLQLLQSEYLDASIDLILSKAVQVFYESNEVEDIKEVLLVTDIAALFWAQLTSHYPDPVKIKRICISDPKKCTHEDERGYNIGKIYKVYPELMSTFQHRHFSKNNGKKVYSKEEVLTYQQNHVIPLTKAIELKCGIKLVLKVPTVARMNDAKAIWKTSIESAGNKIFYKMEDKEKRFNYIINRASMDKVSIRMHWIDHLFLQDDREVSDLEFIYEIVSNLSESEDCDFICSQIDEFVKVSTISAMGIPYYKCPKCNSEPSDDNLVGYYKDMVPINVFDLFFDLRQGKLGLMAK